MKKLVLITFLIYAPLVFVTGQNEPHFTQSFGNEIILNPGAISNKNLINLTLIGRKQWFGFDGSPTSEVFTADTYLGRKYGGVGLSIYNDKVGYENTLNVRAMYAYPVELTNKLILSPGLGFGVINKRIQGSELIYEDLDDEFAIYNDINDLKPDFTVGFELNSADGYKIGMSAIHLDKSNKGATVFDNPRHYYFYGNYIIPIDDKINVIPNVFIKSTLYNTQFEIGSIGTFDLHTWWAGFSYRYQDAFSIMAGIDLGAAEIIDQHIRVGYAYDLGVGGIRTYSSGTHEIVISASFDGFLSQKTMPQRPRSFPKNN
jgi:type IX secretion system PorP/SprF family membrane protein